MQTIVFLGHLWRTAPEEGNDDDDDEETFEDGSLTFEFKWPAQLSRAEPRNDNLALESAKFQQCTMPIVNRK